MFSSGVMKDDQNGTVVINTRFIFTLFDFLHLITDFLFV